MHVYIMANGPKGTLYTGVTNDLGRGVWEHRQGLGSLFVQRYGVLRLVYAEQMDDPSEAIAMEKRIKRRRRDKIALIEKGSPGWDDLSQHIH